MLATFKIPDPYAGKGVAELKADCRRLSRGYSQLQRVTMEMIEALGDDGIEKLSPHSRDYAKRLIADYAD